MSEKERGSGQRPSAGGLRPRAPETAADRARLGTLIAGTYRIGEVLGRGAIGAVFGGVHIRLERPVAVKFVDSSLVDDAHVRARFRREARVAARIGSAHAVEVFDYGIGDDGAPYLVMERLFGEDLHQRLVRDGPLPIDRALRIAKQVCRALGAAHSAGIVHRDLKPENVFLVERDGKAEFVKVVDFGLSTLVLSDETPLTAAGRAVGTPLYMAPEQAGANAQDARVDIYSLGVLLFEMTTGRLPFEASSLRELLGALATGTPRSLRGFDPLLPRALDELVARFIARDPSGRPQSAAAAMAEIVALESHLGGRGGVDDPSSAARAEQPGPSSRPNASVDRTPGRVLRAVDRNDMIEEDSGVFYGRIGDDGTPRALDVPTVVPTDDPSPRNVVTTPAASTLRRGPPRSLVLLALAAFVVVALLVVFRALRG